MVCSVGNVVSQCRRMIVVMIPEEEEEDYDYKVG